MAALDDVSEIDMEVHQRLSGAIQKYDRRRDAVTAKLNRQLAIRYGDFCVRPSCSTRDRIGVDYS